MARIRILWVGKTRERWLAEGIDEYLRRLKPWARVTVVEVKGERGNRGSAALEAEAKRLLNQTAAYFLLDERGKEYSSPDFAAFIGGRDSMDFVLGGPFGVAEAVRQKAAGTIALSRMTLTHEMARLVFMEQLYRAFTILKGKEYHH